MLTWIFGEASKNEIHKANDFMASGYIELKKANVKWFLSVDRDFLPKEISEKNRQPIDQ